VLALVGRGRHDLERALVAERIWIPSSDWTVRSGGRTHRDERKNRRGYDCGDDRFDLQGGSLVRLALPDTCGTRSVAEIPAIAVVLPRSLPRLITLLPSVLPNVFRGPKG
jgi:hypothetical protein